MISRSARLANGIRPCSLVVFAVLLALPAAFARPPRHHRVKPHRFAAVSAHSFTLAKLPPGADRQKLVQEGKLPPFYDPKDLSKPPVLSAPSAILIDADTGQVLWAKNPDSRHYPASTTKILTSLIFIEHTRPEDIITCLDPNITKIEPSSLNIKPWEKFSARDLVYGTLLRSGNDGAVLMAEHVAGSVPKFAAMMNARALQIGATHSHWVTPNGLHDPAHFTTVRDMAMIAREAMMNSRFADAVSQPERLITRSVQIHDSLIITKAKNFWLTFPGADGIKTGYTHQAGHCFVGSATRDGRRLLAVVFEAKNSAVKDTEPILAWGFDRFGMVSFAKPGGAGPSLSIPGAASIVPTTVPFGFHASYDTLGPVQPAEITSGVEPMKTVGTIRKGDVVGRMTALMNGKFFLQTSLVAAADVGRSPLGFLQSGGDSRGADGAKVPIIARAAISTGGGLAFLLVAWRWYGATVTKSARRRRRRLEAARRGADRIG